MSQINNNGNESNNENEAKNINLWQSLKRAIKKSILPVMSLAVIDALLQIFFDYKMNRLAIYIIIFIISLILSIEAIEEWKRSRLNKK